MLLNKRCSLSLLLMVVAGFSHAATFNIDKAHSTVGFKVRHLVSKTSGQFNSFSGTFDYDEKTKALSAVSTEIQTASVNTNEPKRDEHLRGADFFNVEKFPTMTFKSTKAMADKSGVITLIGDLTLLGVTKPVTLTVDGGQVAQDPWGGTRTGFSAKGTLNRKDWGMVFNMTVDKGGVVIGDEVELLIEVEGTKKK